MLLAVGAIKMDCLMAFQRPDPAGICFCAGATAFAQRFAQRLVQRALQRVAEDLATGPVKLRGFGDDSVGSCLAGSRWISLDLAGLVALGTGAKVIGISWDRSKVKWPCSTMFDHVGSLGINCISIQVIQVIQCMCKALQMPSGSASRNGECLMRPPVADELLESSKIGIARVAHFPEQRPNTSDLDVLKY